LVDPVSPLDSAIALTLPSETGPDTENGLLQAWEILQDLRLKNQLVVLSACRSASGRSMGGAGRVGLTWAFQAAGARSVVAPLWNIRDDVAPDFMARFYLSLRAGMPKDEALRQAQLSILSLDASAVCNTCERPPPYLWAAFQLYGDRH
jgi:CHAT domain-containing protein